jgi:glycosyltransferase involved in cell wall biosynthesis
MQNVLVFLGDGELGSSVREKAAEYKNLLCKGRVYNVLDYLRAADFFVSASQAEGLPNTVLEALACGLPVLLSDIEPHKEIVELNSAVGRLYTLGDKSSFINTFGYLECSDYDKMSDAAYKLANEELSAKVMSLKYQKVYLGKE